MPSLCTSSGTPLQLRSRRESPSLPHTVTCTVSVPCTVCKKMVPDILQCCGDPGLLPLVQVHMGVGHLIVVDHVQQRHQVPPSLLPGVEGPKGVGLNLRSTASSLTQKQAAPQATAWAVWPVPDVQGHEGVLGISDQLSQDSGPCADVSICWQLHEA